MSRNYKFHNPEGLYFVSFAVVEWLDVFSRDSYSGILALKYATEGEFSYPAIIQDAQGFVQIFYTHNRNKIRYVKFQLKK